MSGYAANVRLTRYAGPADFDAEPTERSPATVSGMEFARDVPMGDGRVALVWGSAAVGAPRDCGAATADEWRGVGAELARRLRV